MLLKLQHEITWTLECHLPQRIPLWLKQKPRGKELSLEREEKQDYSGYMSYQRLKLYLK